MNFSASELADIPDAVRTVLRQEMSAVFGTITPQELNDQFLKKYPNSQPHIFAGTSQHGHTSS